MWGMRCEMSDMMSDRLAWCVCIKVIELVLWIYSSGGSAVCLLMQNNRRSQGVVFEIRLAQIKQRIKICVGIRPDYYRDGGANQESPNESPVWYGRIPGWGEYRPFCSLYVIMKLNVHVASCRGWLVASQEDVSFRSGGSSLFDEIIKAVLRISVPSCPSAWKIPFPRGIPI